MQNGIPLAYNVCEVKSNKTSIWMCKYRAAVFLHTHKLAVFL